MFSKVLPAFFVAALFCAAVGYKTLKNEAKTKAEAPEAASTAVATEREGGKQGLIGIRTNPMISATATPTRFAPQRQPQLATPSSETTTQISRQAPLPPRRSVTSGSTQRQYPIGVNPEGMKFLTGEVANTKNIQGFSGGEMTPGSTQSNPFVK